MDMNATYTVTLPGDTEPRVIEPKVRTRQRGGVQVTTIMNLAPLLAEHIDAISDEGNRLHTLTVLSGAIIVIRDAADENDEHGQFGHTSFRDHGRLNTDYAGTPDLPVSTVLDLAEQLRDTL